MEFIVTNTELTTKKRRIRCRAQRIMMCHSNVVVQMPCSIYFLSKPIMFEIKSISSNAKKQTESQTPQLKVELLQFHFKNHNHCVLNSLCNKPLHFLVMSTVETLYNFYFHFTHSKKRSPTSFLFSQARLFMDPNGTIHLTSLTRPCCTQGSCCVLNSMITEVGYLAKWLHPIYGVY